MKFLIVEDSRLFANLVKQRVSDNFRISCEVTGSYQETEDVLEQDPSRFSLAILDLTLPGSPDGEIVDLVMSKGISVIVSTGRMDDQIRDNILRKNVIDYIMKGPHTLDLISNTIRRFLRNQDFTILVVDDSSLIRSNISTLLENQNFNVVEATNGSSALKLLEQTPSIQLVITDYNMPQMDGFELTAAIRKKYPINKIAIIGMSAYGNPLLSSQFLKRGANDFLNKPYFTEELIWRVNQNVELLDQMMQLRDASITDSMTGIHNRHYLFQTGEKLFENARRKNLQICVGMVDIDLFKKVNDTYGHACGDDVITEVARTLQKSIRKTDIVARTGGEEFVIITSNHMGQSGADLFENVRRKIEGLSIETHGYKIETTISIGVTTVLEDRFEGMLKKADELLYQAKESGRNKVVMC